MRFRRDLGDLSDLKKSIQEIGQLHPCIFTSEGKLISGERRLEACKQLGIEPLIRIVDFSSSEQREQAEIQENTIRKEFLPSEIFEIYQFYSKKLSKQGKRTDLKLCTEYGRSNKPIETIARLTGKNKDTISKINNVFNFGDDDLKKRVDSGSVSINEADRIVKKDKKIQYKIDRFTEVSKDFKSTDIQIHYKDFCEFSKSIDDNTVDLVCTDPPYSDKYLDLWEQLFEVSFRILKPSKFLIFYFGQQYLDKLFRVKNDLNYYWSFKLDFKIPYLVKSKNIITTYKLAMIYQKPPYQKLSFVQSDRVQEKTFIYDDRILHTENWGQNIDGFEFLIDRFSMPNDLIFDPMAGTGTTLLACQRMKRRGLGCEIDEKYKPIIEGRLKVNE